MRSNPTTHPTTMSHSGRVTVITKPHGSHSRRLALQSSRSLTEATAVVETPYCHQIFQTRFSDDFHSDRRAQQYEHLSPIYPLMEALSENTSPRVNLQSDVEIHMSEREALFGHAPPPAVSSTADKPIQPLHAPRRRRKSSHFPLFLFDDCF